MCKVINGLVLLMVLVFVGCADTEAPPPESAGSDSAPGSATTDSTATDPDGSVNAELQTPPRDDFQIKPIGTSGSTGASDATASGQSNELSGEQRISVVMETLKPLQIMLGQWRGTTRREFSGFKAVDKHEWVWDLQTDPQQPALALVSDKSPYLREARLTWDPRQSTFQLTAKDETGATREYTGDYTEPVREIIGSDDKLHRVFRLELTQTPQSASGSDGQDWQIAFAQQESNRYLLEISKRRGSAAFKRHDVVSTQRDGTSFAVSDEGYGDKTCIISQGLGTTAVSYKGKTYWVCCSGCKAAFEEDPETWIARAEKRAAMEK